MSVCKDTRKWMRQEVSVPIQKFTTEMKEVCKNVRQKIEEEVQQPVESWVNDEQRRCEQQPWWSPLRWICVIVLVAIKVITWVLVTVVKWVTTIVCQVVTVTVAVVVAVVTVVIAWMVGFLVCAVDEPGAAVGSIGDLWIGILDIGEEIIDFIDVILDDIDGIITDVEGLVDTIGHMFGPIGNLIAGIIKWAINLVRSVIDIIRAIVDAGQGIFFGIFKLNWCRAFASVTEVGVAIVRIVLLPPRIIFGVIGGIRDAFEGERLETTVDQALIRAFRNDPDGLARARKKVRLGGRPFGLPITVQARRFFVSSSSTRVDLRQLHANGAIDLYEAAGYWTECPKHGFNTWQRWEVVYTGTTTTVSPSDLRLYLDEGPAAVPDFRVYAMTMDVLMRNLQLAKRKATQIGLTLTWTINEYEVTRTDEVPLGDTRADNDKVMERVGRKEGEDDLCRPPAIAMFGFTNPKRNGRTSWVRSGDVHPSGVTFKDRLPEMLYRWVLIHELGHYFGLDHEGHDGVENIMFTADPGEDLQTITPGSVAEYALLTGESRFFPEDAEVVWRWIPEQAKRCLT